MYIEIRALFFSYFQLTNPLIQSLDVICSG